MVAHHWPDYTLTLLSMYHSYLFEATYTVPDTNFLSLSEYLGASTPLNNHVVAPQVGGGGNLISHDLPEHPGKLS